MWSNCKEGTYCEHTEETAANGQKYYLHNENYTYLALVPFEEVGDDRVFMPVIQFLTVNQHSLLSDDVPIREFMSITLAHEMAHTLGMSDVYNNYFYSHVSGHSGYDETQCVMSTFDEDNARTYYESVVDENATALCDDCKEILHEEMVDDLYES